MNQINIKVVKVHPDVKLPEYAHEGDAGMDLCYFGKELIQLMPGQTTLIPTGIKIQLPLGKEAQIRPRSGLSLKTGLRIVNSPGTIDSNFTGEVMVIAQNTGNTVFTLLPNDRIAQMVITDYYKGVFIEVDELNDTNRGENGFGSSGINVNKLIGKDESTTDF